MEQDKGKKKRMKKTGSSFAACLAALLLVLSLPAAAFAAYLYNDGECYYGGYSTSIFRGAASGDYDYMAYCVMPQADTPPCDYYGEDYGANWWGAHEGWTDVRTMLFFCWGGPGFDFGKAMGVWPTQSWDGGSFYSGPQYYVASHIVLSDSYQWNADLTLYGTDYNFRNWAQRNLLGYFGGASTTQNKMLALRSYVPSDWYGKCFIMHGPGDTQDVVARKGYNTEAKLRVNPNGGVYRGSSSTMTMSPNVRFGSSNWYHIGQNGNATRAGYTLKGYYTATSGGTMVYRADGTCVNGCGYWVNNVYCKCTDLTVHAQWNPISYSVTYDLAGGSFGAAHPTSATYDQAFTVSNPTRSGYRFAGWTITGMDSTTHVYGSKTTTATSLSGIADTSFKNLRASGGTVKFTAVWVPNSYNISYDLAGGSFGASHPTTAGCNSTVTISNPTRTGYVFAGWTITNMDSTTHTYGSRTTTATSLTGVTDTSFKNLRYSPGTVNFTAVWKPITYYVEFAGNGATGGSTQKMTCSYDSEYSLSPNGFERAGWAWASWNLKQDGSGAGYGNQARIKNLTATQGTTITLYAQWNPTVTYVVDGEADYVKASDTVGYRTSFTVPAARTSEAHRDNCTHIDGSNGFDGWYTDPACTAKWVDGTTVTAPTVLYARNWATITFQHGAQSIPGQTYERDGASGTVDELAPLPVSMEGTYNADCALPDGLDGARIMQPVPGSFPVTLRAMEGWCATRECDGSPVTAIALKGNATMYKPWSAATREGVASVK